MQSYVIFGTPQFAPKLTLEKLKKNTLEQPTWCCSRPYRLTYIQREKKIGSV